MEAVHATFIGHHQTMVLRPIHSLRKRLAKLRRFPSISYRDEATFILDPRNWIDNRILAGVRYEDAQLAFVRSEIRRRRLSHVIDIGANIGLYTVLLGREATVAAVHAFEPVRRNYNQLLGNVFANRLDMKVTAHRLGLGDRTDELVIHVDPTSTGVSRLDLSTTARNLSVFTDQETIQVRRLDDVIALDHQRIFSKIDVEGMAEAVVRGMPRLLDRNTGLLQVEISKAEQGAAELLETHGWRPVRQIEADWYFAKE